MTTQAIPGVEPDEDFGPFERITLPKVEFYYRDDNHSYWQGCQQKREKGQLKWTGSGRLTGVTTVIAPWDFKPDSLMRWVETLTLEGVTRGFGGQTLPSDPHALRGLLASRALRWEDIREEKGDRGKRAHSLVLHALAVEAVAPSLDVLPKSERGFAQGIMRWWDWRRPEVLNAEQPVASLEWGFAGTLDMRCRIKGRDGVGIVDMKTSESGFVSNKALVQPAGYDLGCMHSGIADEPADWYMVLHVNERGDFREVFSPATHEDFLLSMAVYRRASAFVKAATS